MADKETDKKSAADLLTELQDEEEKKERDRLKKKDKKKRYKLKKQA